MVEFITVEEAIKILQDIKERQKGNKDLILVVNGSEKVTNFWVEEETVDILY